MRYASAIQWILALNLLLLTACPSGSKPGGTGVTDSPVSNEERLASLDQAQAIVEKYNLNGDPAVSDQIAAELKTMPDFADVQVYAGSVIARFTDDELLVVINTRPPDESFEPTATTEKSIASAALRDRQAGPSPLNHSIIRQFGDPITADMPASDKALLVNAMGTSYRDDTSTLNTWFSRAGYKTQLYKGTVEDFRNFVTDIGVLYVSSHGALIPASMVPAILKDVLKEAAETLPPTAELASSDGLNHFCVWTQTPITNDTVGTYRAEVRSGRLEYCIAQNNKTANGGFSLGRHFLITEAFILDHWRCLPKAMIFMDCCWAASGIATQTQSDMENENKLLWKILLYSDVNASVFVGWSRTSYIQYTSKSVRYFFDRMLGANGYLPVSTLQRPFPLLDVAKQMEQRRRSTVPLDPGDKPQQDLTLDQSVSSPSGTIAELICLMKSPTRDSVLVPGVMNVSVGKNIMTVKGALGSNPKTVTMGGQPCPVVGDDSNDSQIQCQVPDGLSGPVVVSAGTRVSNPRNLTQWNITFHRLFMDFPTQAATDCPSCFYEATLHYTFRADAGPTRLNLDDSVVPTNYTGAADDGSIDVTNAGGTYSIGQGSSITLAPNPDDGAALIGTCTGFSPPFDNNYLGACFFLQGGASLIAFSPTISAEGLLRNYHGGTFDGIVDPYQVVYSGNIVGNELNLSLSPNFTIEAGQQSTGPNSYFQWDAADAQSPPDPNDPQ